ncbi:MAG: radical SAM protein [Deltaproteobacteria bacterium]|nr:radical SAM protein [Deltaproteobacteria bacterium]
MKINHDVVRRSTWAKNLHRWRSQRSPWGYLVNRFQWHYYPRLKFLKDYPLHLDLELSSRCQLQCPMCFRQHRPLPSQGFMSFDLFKKIIDEVAGRVYSLKFTGRGEALLHPELPRFLAYLGGKKFGEVAMITNGLLLTPELMESLFAAGMDFVSFSIDGLAEKYQEIRRPGRYAQIQEIVAGLQAAKAARGRAKPLVRVQSVQLPPDEEAAYLREWQPLADDIFFIFFKDYSAAADGRTQMAAYTCPLPFQRLMVHYNGTVPMCINDEYEDSVLGDLNRQTVREVWRGPALHRAREVQRRGRRTQEYANCRRCALNREGHGK